MFQEYNFRAIHFVKCCAGMPYINIYLLLTCQKQNQSLILPPCSVSSKIQELSVPSPFLVNPNILMQYQVKGTTLCNTVTYVFASITV